MSLWLGRPLPVYLMLNKLSYLIYPKAKRGARWPKKFDQSILSSSITCSFKILLSVYSCYIRDAKGSFQLLFRPVYNSYFGHLVKTLTMTKNDEELFASYVPLLFGHGLQNRIWLLTCALRAFGRWFPVHVSRIQSMFYESSPDLHQR